MHLAFLVVSPGPFWLLRSVNYTLMRLHLPLFLNFSLSIKIGAGQPQFF